MRVVIYTYGVGAGHLARVNAVVKGFSRTNLSQDISVHAPRTKYRGLLDPQARLVSLDELPKETDIFICDWKVDGFVESLPHNYARLWVGLRRLGRIPSAFPRRFFVVAVEPSVRGDLCIWPVISTWKDELVSEAEFRAITRTESGAKVALLCENGCYEKHPTMVLREDLIGDGHIGVRCSNSPYARRLRDLDYWPIARLFPHAARLVIGGGYNSIHEAICFSSPERLVTIHVGGDDQALRLKKYTDWWELSPGDSRGEELASILAGELKA